MWFRRMPSSRSSRGSRLGNASMIATSDPSLLNMQPNSVPSGPPPMMIRLVGTSSRCSALSLVITSGDSTPGIGIVLALDPVATIIWDALRVTTPSSWATAIVLGELILPTPFTSFTPFDLRRCSIPWTRRFTTLSILSVSFLRSQPGSRTARPNSSALLKSETSSAALTRALVGMHPQLVQVPPRRSFSTSTTLPPS